MLKERRTGNANSYRSIAAQAKPSSPPGHLNANAVRITDQKLSLAVPCTSGLPGCGSGAVGVEVLHADAEVINPTGLIALLQDDQPAGRQVVSMIIWPLNPS